MNEIPPPDPMLDHLRERERVLLLEQHSVSARLEEVRDMIGKLTDGRRKPKSKAKAEPEPRTERAPTLALEESGV